MPFSSKSKHSSVRAVARLALSIIFFSQCVPAEDLPPFCYLPTENNVSYSAVLDLPKSQPIAVLQYGKDPLQFGELWLPDQTQLTKQRQTEQAPPNYPLLVLIHGGCWLNEYDISHTHALSSALAANGYAVWAIEYRRTGDLGGGWPGTYEDIKLGIKFSQTLDSYPVDLSKVMVLGHSAGGHLALLAGADTQLVESANIIGVVGLAAITDIEQYALGENSCQAVVSKFMGGSSTTKKQYYLDANPAGKNLHSNTFLLQGTEDKIVPISQAAESDAQMQLIQGAGHFDMIHPATPSYQALLKRLAQFY